MKGAMVVTWTGTRPGRERMALDYGRDVDDYFSTFVAEGKCTSPKWFFARSGTSVWSVEGELEDLLLIGAAPEAMRLITKGPLINEDFTVEYCSTDRDMMFANFEGTLDELKI